MDITFVKALMDYGVLGTMAITMFLWLIRVELPRRDKQGQVERERLFSLFKEERQSALTAYKEDRVLLLTEFREDRSTILEKLQVVQTALNKSVNTCAHTRGLNMIQYLLERDSTLNFETASKLVRQYWITNGVD